jgi:hypothetical protein
MVPESRDPRTVGDGQQWGNSWSDWSCEQTELSFLVRWKPMVDGRHPHVIGWYLERQNHRPGFLWWKCYGVMHLNRMQPFLFGVSEDMLLAFCKKFWFLPNGPSHLALCLLCNNFSERHSPTAGYYEEIQLRGRVRSPYLISFYIFFGNTWNPLIMSRDRKIVWAEGQHKIRMCKYECQNVAESSTLLLAPFQEVHTSVQHLNIYLK